VCSSDLFEVKLADDGQSLKWVGRGTVTRDGSGAALQLDAEPTPPWWQQLPLWLLSALVPDEWL